MKYRIFIPIILLAFELPFAQLLPQKSENPSVKIDRALIFKVDYNDADEAIAADSISKKSNPPLNETKKKEDPLVHSMIETGACITVATLLGIFNNNIPVGCIPLPSP